MKASLLLPLVFMLFTACGGDTRVDDNHLLDPVYVNGTGAGCTAEVLTDLNEVTELCSRNPLVGEVRELCFSKAEAYRLKHPTAVCNLEGQAVVAAELVEEEIEAIETEEEELINSGIFDD